MTQSCLSGDAPWGSTSAEEGGGPEERERRRAAHVPDAICGDLDSARGEVLDYYRARGAAIARDGDQDTNDLDKCLSLLLRMGADAAGAGSAANAMARATAEAALAESETKLKQAVRSLETISLLLLFAEDNWLPVQVFGVLRYVFLFSRWIWRARR